MISAALFCLSLNVYNEARGEQVKGQFAVAEVTWNRAEHKARKVCKVVTEPRQFSWTISGLKFERGHYHLTNKGTAKDKKAWNMSLQVAKYTMMGYAPDVVHGATYYHTKQVKPFWAKDYKLVAVVGQHLFYKAG